MTPQKPYTTAILHRSSPKQIERKRGITPGVHFELNNISNGRQSDANDFCPIRRKDKRSIKTCRLNTFSDGMFHY